MAGSEAERRSTGVQVLPVVVVVGNSEMASILSRVAVRVSNKGCLPVVMEVVVGDGDPVTTVGDVKQAVVVVFVMVHVGGEIVVIDPNIGGGLNGNGIGGCKNLLNLETTNDNVLHVENSDSNVDKGWKTLVIIDFAAAQNYVGEDLLAP